jgi:hypothetical protein
VSPNVPTSKVAGDNSWAGLAAVRKKAAVSVLAAVRKKAAVSGGAEMAVRNPVGDV